MNFSLENTLTADILIVDDMPNNLRLLSTILSSNGYDVRKATNGEMALNSIRTMPPDLILLDIKMPKMDGYETCREIKNDPRFSHIPIIFISALDDVSDKVKAFDMGGVDYVTKPFQQEEIIARIENQLRIQFLNKELDNKNKSLQELNTKLETSNQRLKEFAHIVSHDLKQPIQSIMGFSNLILMQHKAELNNSVIKHLNRINQAGDRMQGFISSLLTLAQVEQGDRPLSPIDGTAVITQVIENLQGKIHMTQANVSCDLLPMIIGNQTQLVQLFQNIIGNALKYSHPDRPPNIKITAQSTETLCTVKIQDNGIGIAPEFLPQIFQPFKKAHQGDYEGNGIGLATCKKIVDCHHGTISASSELGHGSIFTVTLPKAENVSY